MLTWFALFYAMTTAPHGDRSGEAIVHRAACMKQISGQCLEVAQNTGGSGGSGGGASAPVTVIIQQNTQGGTGGGGGAASGAGDAAGSAQKPAGGSCGALWQERNSIYARNGYCFKTDRARSVFGDGCFPPYGRLSGREKSRVNQLQMWERRKGC